LVVQIDMQIGQQAKLRLDPGDPVERHADMSMARMGFVAQGVDDPNGRAAQRRHRIVVEAVDVRRVCERAYTNAAAGFMAVDHVKQGCFDIAARPRDDGGQVFDFVAMIGCYFLCIRVLQMDEAIFWDRTALWLNPSHINEGLIKAAVFGLVFSLICTYRGFSTKGGARGVGDATNRGVVLSMVMIIILDFFLMNLIEVYYKMTA
jgi:hypothetical protein